MITRILQSLCEFVDTVPTLVGPHAFTVVRAFPIHLCSYASVFCLQAISNTSFVALRTEGNFCGCNLFGVVGFVFVSRAALTAAAAVLLVVLVAAVGIVGPGAVAACARK